ncbi:MAG: hypothetical protein HYR55_11845 [Acidobacteria bacterium]|nr:hypothetical protein [Acidobacteriota bacterium]MBI3655859.1 hypothetical protein [Acidobacteriota bacterium]
MRRILRSNGLASSAFSFDGLPASRPPTGKCRSDLDHTMAQHAQAAIRFTSSGFKVSLEIFNLLGDRRAGFSENNR